MKEPAENKMHALTEAYADVDEPEPTIDELRETGNGPTVSYEEALLTQYFGPADANGVHGADGVYGPWEVND